jgi:Ca2+-binding EF-hand superfamily protein
MLEVFRKKVI